jgi:hypothetical protein
MRWFAQFLGALEDESTQKGWKGGEGGLQNDLHRVPPTQKGPARTVSQLKAAVPSTWCQSLLCGLCCRSLRVHRSAHQNLVLSQSGRKADFRCARKLNWAT